MTHCLPLRFIAVCLAITVFACSGTLRGASEGNQGDMVLWYRQAAQQWLGAMPLGNGLIGAMVFGGVQRERIALNEGTFWSGRPHDYDNPEAFKYFPQIRDLVFAGKFQEAEKLANAHFWGIPKSQEAYQPIGDLILSFADAGVTDYRRELDMETGVAKVSYRQGDAACTVTAVDGRRFELAFEVPQWAVTPGQSAVLYDGEVSLGGGVIEAATASRLGESIGALGRVG